MSKFTVGQKVRATCPCCKGMIFTIAAVGGGHYLVEESQQAYGEGSLELLLLDLKSRISYALLNDEVIEV